MSLSPAALRRACASVATIWLSDPCFQLATAAADAGHAALADELRDRSRASEKRLLLELESVREEERRGWVGVQEQVDG